MCCACVTSPGAPKSNLNGLLEKWYHTNSNDRFVILFDVRILAESRISA